MCPKVKGTLGKAFQGAERPIALDLTRGAQKVLVVVEQD